MSRRGVLVLLALVVASLVVASPAGARDSYCSSTGDYCTSAKRRNGAIYLRIGTFSFQGRVRICVTGRTRVCHRYPLRLGPQGIYEAKVRWYGSYPNQGPRTYRVTFFLGATQLGPTLAFRIV